MGPPDDVFPQRKRANSAPNACIDALIATETESKFSRDDTLNKVKLKRKPMERESSEDFEVHKRRDRPRELDEEDKVEENDHELENDQEHDQSFFDLLKTFASLDLPTEPEKCPLCPASFPVQEFATHVYECIKQLDHAEQKYQLERDEALAVQLSLQTNGQEIEDQLSFPTLPQGSMCPQGLSCRRYDVSHHNWFKHPEASCPICGEEFTVYDIDAHVVLCLNRPQDKSSPFSSSSKNNQFSSSSSSSSNSSSTFGRPDFDVSGFDSPRDNDDSDDDTKDLAVPGLHRKDSDDMEEAESTEQAGQLGGECGLSVGQMGAMSRIVLEQRSKSASQQDVSLVQLLDTFKTLGFTKENLTKALKPSEK